jgi:class 3 adenylate cyclase
VVTDDLDAIRREFLQFAPHYAQREAEEALDSILALQRDGRLRTGLYYLVLIDLVGSTTYMAEHGNPRADDRIKHFVRSSYAAVTATELANVAVVIKEIGDALLLVFTCFPDIIRWQAELEPLLAEYEPGDEQHRIAIRTCVHVGDVLLSGVNPIALAVSQLFKFEKDVGEGQIVLTETAYQVGWPTLARAFHAFEQQDAVELTGYPDPMPLYRLRRAVVSSLAELLTEETTEFPEGSS